MTEELNVDSIISRLLEGESKEGSDVRAADREPDVSATVSL